MTSSQLFASSAQLFDGDPVGAGAHERVVFAQDRRSGLKALIAIHNTLLGPALGGTRFYPYRNEQDALLDVLRLSAGMTYKAAIAGLNLGGGKAVIIGDPLRVKSEELLEAYGRLVESLNGLYITAGDVGTTSADMDVVGRATSHVVARTKVAGGSGDTAPLTAYGVFQSMRAAAARVWGDRSLDGRTIGVEGLGKVGRELVGLLVGAGARVVACDPIPSAREQAVEAHAELGLVERVIDSDVDIYAPCAMGATVTPGTVGSIRARIICGAANNQLLSSTVEESLLEANILWVPDYVANAGGLIQVAGELGRQTAEDSRTRVNGIFETVEGILKFASDNSITAGAAADHFAQDRLDSFAGPMAVTA